MKRILQIITVFLIINTSAMAAIITAEGYAESCAGWGPDCFQDHYLAMENLRKNGRFQCYGEMNLVNGPTCKHKITMPISSTTCSAEYECHLSAQSCYEECIEIEVENEFQICHSKCGMW